MTCGKRHLARATGGGHKMKLVGNCSKIVIGVFKWDGARISNITHALYGVCDVYVYDFMRM